MNAHPTHTAAARRYAGVTTARIVGRAERPSDAITVDGTGNLAPFTVRYFKGTKDVSSK